MKRRAYSRQKIFIIGYLVLIVGISLNVHTQAVSAWKNGSYADTPEAYTYSENYGTHDWIADAALDYLLSINSSQWSWLDSRREIFFLGTEAPDNGGIDIVLDGISVSGFGDTTLHHIYFYENGSVFENEDDAAIRAKWCGDWADVQISSENWDLAAFYLGAMTHYIADMGMYAHVAANNVAPYYLNFDEFHSTVEGYVNTRSNEVEDPEEFFAIELPLSLNGTSPYNAALETAWETYADPTPTLAFSRGTLWMHENFFTGWALTQEAREAEINQTKTAYYDRLEETILGAISGCIRAMLYVGNGIAPISDDDQTVSDDDDQVVSDDDQNSSDDSTDDGMDDSTDDTVEEKRGFFQRIPFASVPSLLALFFITTLGLTLLSKWNAPC